MKAVFAHHGPGAFLMRPERRSKCWYTIPKENIRKLDDRTSEAIMIGYPKITKGYKLWDFKAQKIIISREVLFNQEKQSIEICEQDNKNDDESTNLTPNIKDVDVVGVDDLDGTNDASGLDDVPGISNEYGTEIIEPSVEKNIGVRRSGRIRNAPGPWWANTAFIATCTEPKTFYQANTCDDAPQWKSAMSAVYESLMKHNTWNIVPRPQDRNIVTCKWIFKTEEIEV
jgi:hypothetical protein